MANSAPKLSDTQQKDPLLKVATYIRQRVIVLHELGYKLSGILQHITPAKTLILTNTKKENVDPITNGITEVSQDEILLVYCCTPENDVLSEIQEN